MHTQNACKPMGSADSDKGARLGSKGEALVFEGEARLSYVPKCRTGAISSWKQSKREIDGKMAMDCGVFRDVFDYV